IFVHSATTTHFEIVKLLLEMGLHVYVDKPLTDNIEQSEQLIELAIKQKRMLMVGFNRRFAPFYVSLKQNMTLFSSLRMDKHRSDSVGPKDARFTLLDDYLHVVDTVLWIAGTELKLISGGVKTTEQGELFYAEHHFQTENGWVTT
ncbi:Gfo/Idh/MocA family oxidoreductase, partial [Bacillus cereus]